jgi:hypothetical protein
MEEKASIVDKNLEMIQLGIEEAQVMMSLASHLQYVEAEKQKLKAQVNYRFFSSNKVLMPITGASTVSGERVAARRTRRYTTKTPNS